MKIIIAPSKTQDFSNKINKDMTLPVFEDKANKLAQIIDKYSKEDLGKVMKIKGKLLDETYKKYQDFKSADINHAIETYSGAVFKGINIDKYNDEEMKFLNRHLIILSALYGVLKPFDGIKPYRLDMTMSIMEESLYKYWTEDVTDFLKDEEVIINLASSEFSKLVKLPMITIEFKEQKDGKYKTIGTYAKKARGLMVDYIIRNKIINIEEIKSFNLEAYTFNTELSNENKFVFTR